MKDLKSNVKEKPVEMSTEELRELMYQIAKIEADRRPDIKVFMDVDDIIQEILWYAHDKQARGKGNILDLQKQVTEKHFRNILHNEARMGINYVLRKTKSQIALNGTSSFDEFVNEDGQSDNSDKNTSLYGFVEDRRASIDNMIDERSDITDILMKLDTTEVPGIKIKYDDVDCKFSFRNFAVYYYTTFTGSKISNKEVQASVLDANTEKELDISTINKLIKAFKVQVKEAVEGVA